MSPVVPPPRLVIIDDEPRLVEVVAAIARDAFPDPKELVIESIFTAEAAILAIRRASAAHEVAIVVISDFQLPPSKVDGLEVLAEVKKRLPLAKRALMTGRDVEEFGSVLDQARLDAFVAKPFTFHEMRALIARLVAEVAGAEPAQLPLVG